MQYSPFYLSSPAGNELIRYGRSYAREHPGSAATNEFLCRIPKEPELAALHAAVHDQGNLHSEIGRQIRDELRADIYRKPNGKPVRISVKGAVHKSYTPLRLPTAQSA